MRIPLFFRCQRVYHYGDSHEYRYWNVQASSQISFLRLTTFKQLYSQVRCTGCGNVPRVSATAPPRCPCTITLTLNSAMDQLYVQGGGIGEGPPTLTEPQHSLLTLLYIHDELKTNAS